MACYRGYFYRIDDAIEKEISGLYQEYGLSRNVLNRIRTF